MQRSVTPLSSTAYLSQTKSSQPQRRGLPVDVPYSCPSSRIVAPILLVNSVGKGPSPTLEVYAFIIPYTELTFVGPTPAAAAKPDDMHDDEVTSGYVP